MLKSYLGKGIDYYRIRNSILGLDLDVVRIGSDSNPFIINSTMGKPIGKPPIAKFPSGSKSDLPTTRQRRPNTIKKTRSYPDKLLLAAGNFNNFIYPVIYHGKPHKLVPLWVSNGTFFLNPPGNNWELPSWVSGPIRDAFGSLADTPYSVRTKDNKGWRSSYGQPLTNPFDFHFIEQL